jgi:hypothetical protein
MKKKKVIPTADNAVYPAESADSHIMPKVAQDKDGSWKMSSPELLDLRNP